MEADNSCNARVIPLVECSGSFADSVVLLVPLSVAHLHENGDFNVPTSRLDMIVLLT